MSISSSTRKAGPYTGNGVTTAFPFAFKVFSSSDVRVVRTDLSGIESDLTLTADYTVTLNADQDSDPGGTVTLVTAAETGYKTTLASQVDELQPVVLTNAGGFYPRVINDALDRLTIMVQQLSEKLSRSLKYSISSPLGDSALPAPVANNIIGWDSSASGFQNYAPVDNMLLSATLAASGGSSLIGFRNSGTGAVTRTTQDKMRESVSVKDFGAVGNGVAIDTAAVQACLTAGAGKVVVFPAGHTFKLGKLNVPANTYIQSHGATLDFSAADVDGLVFANGGGISGGTLIGFGGTVFGGGSGIKVSGTDNDPLPPTYVTHPVIEGVTIRDFRYHGIFAEFAQHGSVKNCHIHTCGYAGIGGICVNYIDIDGNTIHDIAGTGAPDTYGIFLSALESTETAHPRSTHCTVVNNIIYNVPNWEGIDTHGGTQISIIGNILSNCRFGIAVVGGDTLGVLSRGAKDIVVSGNTVVGRSDGACITVSGTTPEYASGVVVSGNVLKDGGQAGSTASGAIRVYNCYNITITGNSIQTPYVFGINLIQNISASTISGNTIVDVRDNINSSPSCIAVTSHSVCASIFGNTFVYASSGVGIYVSVLSISIFTALTGLDIDIGRNAFRGISATTLNYYEGTSTGVNASGLTVASGRVQLLLTNVASNGVSVTFPERFPVASPRITMQRVGTPVPGSVLKSPQLETNSVAATGFGITARPYDLTTFGGSGTLEIDWTATV